MQKIKEAPGLSQFSSKCISLDGQYLNSRISSFGQDVQILLLDVTRESTADDRPRYNLKDSTQPAYEYKET